MASMWGNENIMSKTLRFSSQLILFIRSLVKSNSPRSALYNSTTCVAFDCQEVSDLCRCSYMLRCYGRDTHQQVSPWGRVKYNRSYVACELTRCLILCHGPLYKSSYSLTHARSSGATYFTSYTHTLSLSLSLSHTHTPHTHSYELYKISTPDKNGCPIFSFLLTRMLYQLPQLS